MMRRALSTRERARLFVLHNGVCHFCGGKIDGTREAWDISHDIALELGGADDDANRKLAHRKCHRSHTSTHDQPLIAKWKRRRARHDGSKAPSQHRWGYGRNDPLKKKISGEVVKR